MTAHTVAALHAIVLYIALKYELHAQYLYIPSEARGEQTASLAILWWGTVAPSAPVITMLLDVGKWCNILACMCGPWLKLHSVTCTSTCSCAFYAIPTS